MNYLLGVDIGTSSTKTALFDQELNLVCFAKRYYDTKYPMPSAAEQNADDWYDAFCHCCEEILAKTKISASAISAIGISGMSSLGLPVDSEGGPLRAGMIWLDRRAKAQSEFIHNVLGDKLVRSISGNRSDPSSLAAKIMWLRENEPDVYGKTSKFLHCSSYLVRRLTGRDTANISESGLTQLCDIRTGEYSDYLLEGTGIDRSKLPDIYGCSSVVGGLLEEVASQTGLCAGTPIIAGAMDNVAATVGLGLLSSGDAYVSAGTVTNVGVLSDHPVCDGRGLVYHYGIENKWLINGGVDYGGAGMLWYRNLLENVDFADLDALVTATSLGESSLLFLPYMAGQRAPLWCDDTAGVIYGISPETSRAHMARMFMESVGLGARHVFRELRGSQPARVALTGGITHSKQWSRIFCSTIGAKVSLCDHAEVTALGTAILAGIGVGVYSSLQDALIRLPNSAVLSPEGRDADYYNELFTIFVEAYDSSISTLAKLKKLSNVSLSVGQEPSH